jgi:hypothetical protein
MRQERLIALDVDHDQRVGPVARDGHCGDAIGAGGERRIRQHGDRGVRPSWIAHDRCDPLVVSGHQHLRGRACACLLDHALDHRTASDVEQWLAWQTCGSVTRRDDDVELHV